MTSMFKVQILILHYGKNILKVQKMIMKMIAL